MGRYPSRKYPADTAPINEQKTVGRDHYGSELLHIVIDPAIQREAIRGVAQWVLAQGHCVGGEDAARCDRCRNEFVELLDMLGLVGARTSPMAVRPSDSPGLLSS